MSTMLSAERLDLVMTIFNEALEREPAERARYAAEASGGDAEVRREVESLLAAFDSEQGRFERSPAASLASGGSPAAPSLGASMVGRRIGAYEIVREVGQGGMGAVFEAYRADDAFRNRVAIKMVAAAHHGPHHVRRFLQERRILARLEHPNIARFLDGGITEDGQPWFAMELVEGEPIDRYCTARRLTIRQRLELFRQVCGAAQYAHRNLVVHRDLKPSNILVSADGVVKLLDFGIAKLLAGASESTDGTLTRAGFHALTTAYASPEQLRRDPVTTASDVYSLGVVLYELLTGRRPFDVDEQSPATLARLLDTEPPKPSAVVTDEAARAAGGDHSTRLRRALTGELDNIVLMALRKEPERRYASAHEFSEDLRRYLEGLPVHAQPDTRGYRLRKLVRRNRTAVIAAGLVAVSLVAGAAAATWEARKAAAEARVAAAQARVAERQRDKAQRMSDFLEKMIATGDPSWYNPSDGGRAYTVAQMLDGASRSVGQELRGYPEAEAMVRRAIGLGFSAQGMWGKAEPQLVAALELTRKAHPEPHADLARALHYLGLLRLYTGKYDEAESLVRQAVTVYRQLGRKPEQFYMLAVNDLGTILLYRWRFAEAEPFFADALPIERRVAGDVSAPVAIALGNVGLARYGRGDYRAAEEAFHRALATYAKLPPGREYMERAVSLYNLALVLTWTERDDEAERQFADALAVTTRTLGERHMLRAIILSAVARLHYRRGDYVRASADIRRAYDALPADVSADHVERARIDCVNGLILGATGHAAVAEPVLRHALDVRRRMFDARTYATADCAAALGEALLAQQKYAEAEPLLTESHAALRNALGDDNPQTREAAARLERLHRARSDGDQAHTGGVRR